MPILPGTLARRRMAALESALHHAKAGRAILQVPRLAQEAMPA